MGQCGSVEGLESVLKKYSGRNVLVLCRGDPDPDWLGASVALELLTKPFEISTGYLSTAPVGCAQNQEELDWLGLDVQAYNKAMKLDSYHCFGVLDAHGMDRRLLKPLNGLPWAFLIDHHDPILNGLVPSFSDVRDDVGSTCTILTSYLREKKLLKDGNAHHQKVATSLMYGIRVDTNSMKRAKPADYQAMEYLCRFCDPMALNNLFFQRMTDEDMNLQLLAWDGKVSLGSYVISGVGEIKPTNKVAMAFAADKFIEVYGMNTALIYGIVGGTVQGSLRTCDPTVRPRAFLQTMFPEIYEWGGDCGGHQTGGFSIPLEKVVPEESPSDSRWERVRTFVTSQFFQALGQPVPSMAKKAAEFPRRHKAKKVKNH